MVQAGGADPKAVQGQMRHSRIGATMDIYAQFVPESQQQPVAKMMDILERRLAKGAGENRTINRRKQLEHNGTRL